MRQEESCYWLRLRDEGNFGQQWLRQERMATVLIRLDFAELLRLLIQAERRMASPLASACSWRHLVSTPRLPQSLATNY